MIDLAAVLDNSWLRAALDSALRQRRSYQDWVYRIMGERSAGHSGVARLRALLDEYQRGEEVPASALGTSATELCIATRRRPRLPWNIFEVDAPTAPQLRLRRSKWPAART